MADPDRNFRSGRSIWPLLAFLVGCSVLIWVVADQFLIPAMEAAKDASTGQKRQLVAYARLLLAIVLVILCVTIILLFRVRRFFFPAPLSKRQKTEYIDAWAEAGKRMMAPSADDDEE
jgi:hypothetical protein